MRSSQRVSREAVVKELPNQIQIEEVRERYLRNLDYVFFVDGLLETSWSLLGTECQVVDFFEKK